MSDNLRQHIDEVARRLAKAQRVVCMTGAGVSAESGVPTFRGPGGLWEGHRPEELATPEAFARDREMVWRFYKWRRSKLLQCAPNPAHHAIAEIERRVPTFGLVTQNVDGLHRAAGSRNIVELHGDIWIDRCTACGHESRVNTVPEGLPACEKCGGLARPGVVWFGEMLPPGAFDTAVEWAAQADVVLVVGTSNVVQPAASLADIAQSHGATVVEVNLDPTPLSHSADLALHGKAGEILPRIVEAWAAD